MKHIKCDHCRAVIPDGEEHELTLVAPGGGDVETLIEDICPKCVLALREFCKPLAGEAAV